MGLFEVPSVGRAHDRDFAVAMVLKETLYSAHFLYGCVGSRHTHLRR